MNLNGNGVPMAAPVPAVVQPDLMRVPLVHWSDSDSMSIRNSFEGILCTGSTGSGKSSAVLRALVLPMLKAGFGALFTTTKIHDTSEYTAFAAGGGRRQAVRIFGPDHPWTLNLLETLFHQGGSRGARDTQGVVSALMEILEIKNRNRASGGGEHQFWNDAACELFSSAIDLLAGAGERISFKNMYRIVEDLPQNPEEVRSEKWQSGGFINSLVDRAAAQKGLSQTQEHDVAQAVSFFLGRVPRMDERLRSGIVAQVSSMIFPFLRGKIARLVDGESNLSLESCWANGDIIILDLPIKEYLSGQLLQSLFKYVWQKMLEKRDVRRFPRPVMLVCDEAQNFMTKNDLLFTSTARAARCSTILLTQNLNVLQHQIGESDTQGLVGNLCTKIACANDSTFSNDWYAKMCGEEWAATASTNLSLGGEGGIGAGMQEQRKFNLEPHELVKLRKPSDDFKAAEAVVFRSGLPFKASGMNFLRVVFPQDRK